MTAHKELSSAIATLYEVFKPYPLHPDMDACQHCVTDSDQARVRLHPLPELSAEDLSKFAFKALTTWGSLPDFKHFLPRLLELVARDSELDIETEVVLGKLTFAKWREWPAEEQEAIRSFLQNWWISFLQEFPAAGSAYTVDSCLCSIAQAEDDLTPYLKSWTECESETSFRHLAAFIDWHVDDLLSGSKLSDPFWDRRQPQMHQVVKWLTAPATVRLCRKALIQSPDPTAAQPSVIIEILSSLNTAPER